MDIQHKTELQNADLLVDRVFEGGRASNASDDPLPHLVGVSNQGGFRYIGTKDVPRLVVLTSTLRDVDWPDHLDREEGIFTYYGDNKTPGHGLHETPRFGNLLLRDMFGNAHRSIEARRAVPPILLFANIQKKWRDVEFLGLAVPGAENLTSNEDLVAVWKLKQGMRFQNYQAKFTVLNVPIVSKKWINSVKQGDALSAECPEAWRAWVERGVFQPLKAPRAVEYRTPAEQIPSDESDAEIIATIVKYFAEDPVRFEACAAKIAQLMIPNIVAMDITRPSRDGGRDAVGKLRVGAGASAVLVEFALEAKCYAPTNSVGVKELSRLISRLRHRQFGILVTTSHVALQAYQEIKSDEHPIVIISAIDIARLLKSVGIVENEALHRWLAEF